MDINWNNLEEVVNTPEKDVEKYAEKTQIIELNARIVRLEDISKKKDLGMDALVGSEITLERKKLLAIIGILTKARDAKEKERFSQNRQAQEKWKDNFLIDNLRDFRFISGFEAEHVRRGTFIINTVAWSTPQSTEFEIIGRSNNKIKINLKKIISPTTLQMMIDHPLVPVFLTVESTGAYQHGKRLGIWQHGEWDQTRGIEIRMGTMIAIMKA